MFVHVGPRESFEKNALATANKSLEVFKTEVRDRTVIYGIDNGDVSYLTRNMERDVDTATNILVQEDRPLSELRTLHEAAGDLDVDLVKSLLSTAGSNGGLCQEEERAVAR